MRVLQLQAKKWDKLGGSVHVPPAQTVVAGPVTSTLSTNAPPFVPSDEIEFHYQQPVRNAGENCTLLLSIMCNDMFLSTFLEEWKEYFEGDDEGEFTDQPE